MSNHFIKSFTFLYLNLTMSTVDDINNTITIIHTQIKELKAEILKLEAEIAKLQAEILKLKENTVLLQVQLGESTLGMINSKEEQLIVATKLEYNINKIEQINKLTAELKEKQVLLTFQLNKTPAALTIHRARKEVLKTRSRKAAQARSNTLIQQVQAEI